MYGQGKSMERMNAQMGSFNVLTIVVGVFAAVVVLVVGLSIGMKKATPHVQPFVSKMF
jgi:hypothetical protein